MRAEEKRQEARGKVKKKKESKKHRRGRIANAEKIAQAEKTQEIFPDDVPRELCRLSHIRLVWRLIDGKSMLVAYRIFRGPNKKYGIIPGLRGRGSTPSRGGIFCCRCFLRYQCGKRTDRIARTWAEVRASTRR